MPVTFVIRRSWHPSPKFAAQSTCYRGGMDPNLPSQIIVGVLGALAALSGIAGVLALWSMGRQANYRG